MYALFGAIVLIFTVSFSSCKKEKDFISSNSGGTKLIFNVSSQIGSVNSNKLATVKQSTSQAKSTLAIGNRVSMITNTEENTARKSLISNENKFDKKIASSSLVHDYMRYRILLFNVTKNQIEKSVEAEAGKSLELAVTEGDQYKWYAYSYNTLGRIDTPEIVNNVPVIRTIADKEFLWASSGVSTITATGDNIPPITIIFDHKMAEFVLEIDIADLHGKISDLRINLEDPNYFNTAAIDLYTGIASNPVDTLVEQLNLEDFEYDLSSDSTILRAKLYTAIPENNLENLQVHIRKITVLHDNGSSNNIHTLEDPPKSVTFDFTAPHVSKSHVAQMKFRYKISKKLILHVTATDSGDDHKMALAAQPYDRDLDGIWDASPSHNRPPFNMIKAAQNYGLTNNSIVYTDGFDHMRCSVDGTLDQSLTIPGRIPDIIILSVHYAMDSDDIIALNNYLNNGGVLIMFTAKNGDDVDRDGARNFMRALFNNDSSIDLVSNIYSHGTLFEIDHKREIDDLITNGPFGDLKGRYWGVDYYNVIQMTGIPSDMVTAYSNPSADNRSNTTTALSMFKHNSKNFFWIGNGGFLSGPNWDRIGGWNNAWDKEPFATVLLPDYSNPNLPFNYDFYPMPKKYGSNYTHPILGNIGHSNGSEVYNAPLFANLMAWALYQSEFFGIN